MELFDSRVQVVRERFAYEAIKSRRIGDFCKEDFFSLNIANLELHLFVGCNSCELFGARFLYYLFSLFFFLFSSPLSPLPPPLSAEQSRVGQIQGLPASVSCLHARRNARRDTVAVKREGELDNESEEEEEDEKPC